MQGKEAVWKALTAQIYTKVYAQYSSDDVHLTTFYETLYMKWLLWTSIYVTNIFEIIVYELIHLWIVTWNQAYGTIGYEPDFMKLLSPVLSAWVSVMWLRHSKKLLPTSILHSFSYLIQVIRHIWSTVYKFYFAIHIVTPSGQNLADSVGNPGDCGYWWRESTRKFGL